jgi:DDE_Tnp_1-associated
MSLILGAFLMSTLAIVEVFRDLPDLRRTAGLRHEQALCLALFTLAISAGCRGFLAIQDWLSGYHSELLELFTPPKSRLPSYSTIRRVLLELDYEAYSHCLARFFQIEPRVGETIAIDGKVSVYFNNSISHRAIILNDKTALTDNQETP